MRIKTIAAALIGAALMSLCGCSVGFVDAVSVKYDNADKYTAGDIEITDIIDTLDIVWPMGRLDVAAADSEGVSVKETTKGSLDDKERVHTWQEGSTLHVRFCRSGERYSGEEKQLKITVPKSDTLSNIKINVSSADVSCTGLTAGAAELSASSGDVSFEGDASSFICESSSGNISFSGVAEKISTEASSGDIFITQKGTADIISAETSSGVITIDAEQANKLWAESSSGDKGITLGHMPQSVSLKSSSGDVKLTIPEGSSFDASISTSSGDVSYQLPMSKTGDKSYTCGSGGNKLDITTSSGDVQILKK